ncbi:F-box domain containing protein [Heracleum sosnowskyi]|uniref:F-box domain containing protein n=1 Tax=Heracleum sosnowskyi TaxID=360622 RepID=A0AAD8HB11_9APIA|nr:F-box domain containing protein [Heracleum sosnowskyi]
MDCAFRNQLEFSSQEIVLEEENLLSLILLRVPYMQLVSLKFVSKRWHYVITTPHFTHLLRNSIPHLRATGLFIQRPVYLRSSDEVYFVSLDDPNTRSPFRTLSFAHDPFDPEKIRILQSCNGLLLCSTALYRPKELRNYYVYNPSTNHVETLPEHPPGSGHWVRYVGLIFDPSKSIHYKVIAFDTTSSYPLPYVGNFYIYSSETRTWKASVESFSPPPGANFNGGVYWNGCIHWVNEMNSEIEAESTVSDCLCFNVDDERLETFPRPPCGVRSASRRSLYFGESEGHLHFIEACPYATSLSVYEMKSDYSGWFLKYQIDLDPISKVFPEMTEHKAIFHDKNDYAVAVLSLIRRENFREDPFLVLEVPGKVIRYNLVSRSIKMIWDFSVDFSLEKIDDWSFGNFQVWQYVETV